MFYILKIKSFFLFQSYKLKLRREEALRMLQDASSYHSDSSRSSSPGLESSTVNVSCSGDVQEESKL